MRTITILAVLMMAFAGCTEPTPGEQDGTGDGDHMTGDEEGPITIGAIMPLTGPAASLGEAAMNGARLAVEEINAAGGVDGRDLELMEGDSAFPQTTEAESEFARISGAGVQYIVGALASDSSDAIRDEANDNRVVLVSPASTLATLSGPDHGYFFRVIPSDRIQGAQAAQYSYEDLGHASAAVLYQQTGYARGIKDVFVDNFESLGGTIDGDPVAWENDPNTFDSKAQEVAGLDPDYVWISGQAPEIANLIQALRDKGYDGPIMTSEAIEDSSIFDVASDAIDGVLFTKVDVDTESDAYNDFTAAYEARFDEAPGAFSAFAYDAVYVGAAAIEAAGDDGTAIKAWLEGSGSVPDRVTTDTIRFNQEGDVTTGGYSLWAVDAQGETFAPYTA